MHLAGQARFAADMKDKDDEFKLTGQTSEQ